ncbi:hypothetical protein EAG_15926 [Camponotus floridanus]|uniref:Uncharacterized protein n=1 Tax=Camponotus floridanus TaxID=104421 RepID=E2AQC8_CAMFO|nr:hypothetical protein EAG_15926 [Camponotus floridanus]
MVPARSCLAPDKAASIPQKGKSELKVSRWDARPKFPQIKFSALNALLPDTFLAARFASRSARLAAREAAVGHQLLMGLLSRSMAAILSSRQTPEKIGKAPLPSYFRVQVDLVVISRRTPLKATQHTNTGTSSIDC